MPARGSPSPSRCCSLCSRLAQGQAAARAVLLLYSTAVRILLYSVHAPKYPEGLGSARRALSAMVSTRVFRAAGGSTATLFDDVIVEKGVLRRRPGSSHRQRSAGCRRTSATVRGRRRSERGRGAGLGGPGRRAAALRCLARELRNRARATAARVDLFPLHTAPHLRPHAHQPHRRGRIQLGVRFPSGSTCPRTGRRRWPVRSSTRRLATLTARSAAW